MIGYDPLNEPFPANIYKDPLLVVEHWRFDEEKLGPMFKKAYDKYQLHDSSKIMMFEGTQFPDIWGILGGIVWNIGYEKLPGGDDVTNQLLNDHSYCCQMGAEVCAKGEPPVSLKDKCYDWHKARIGTRAEDAERLKVPLIISEFGACYDS